MNYPIKASLLPAVLFAAIMVFALYVVQLLVVGEDSTGLYTRIVWGNAISPVIVGVFLVAIYLLWDKRRKLAKEKKKSGWFLQDIAPRLLDKYARIEQITDRHAELRDNLLANRWNRMQFDTGSQQTSNTSGDYQASNGYQTSNSYQQSNNDSTLKHAELESEHLQNSYSLPRFFVWALPIIGFTGTVWGIGLSISFFSDTMSASQSGASVSSMLQQNIPLVTKGLSTAFDTTLLALVLSLPATGLLIMTERDERDFLLTLEDHWKRFLGSQYDPAEELIDADYTHAQAVGESLRDLREEAFDRQSQEPDYRN